MSRFLKYSLPRYAIWLTGIMAIVLSCVFKWSDAASVNFMDGDARDYYSALPSVFIAHDFLSQSGSDWFLLKLNGGVINVHPVGVAILLLPFFLLAFGAAAVFHFPTDGFSLPFQVAIALAALTYALTGLVYLKRLLKLHSVSDATSALIIVLLFLGTNLLNYTVSEAGMSHVYSFCLISAFLYHSSALVMTRSNRHLLSAGALFGLICLVRPNNALVALSFFLWFKSFGECRSFFRGLFKSRSFYAAAGLALVILLLQNSIWLLQSGSFFHDTYKADGFYWLRPHILSMLFGFDNGFFIYTPLILLFCAGLLAVYRESRFSFFATAAFLLLLFYFFACYWAYTYFDGLGIRVLVDYYALFAFLGARLFTWLSANRPMYATLTILAAALGVLSLVYCYQASRQILLRSGMTYRQWNYIFLKTGKQYEQCLGGHHDLPPYAKEDPSLSLSRSLVFEKPFDFSEKDFGPVLSFDSINFRSNRIHLKINCARRELLANASKNALLCITLKNKDTDKSYFHFRLNETPAGECCEEVRYAYTSNMNGDFRPGDQLAVYLWNPDRQPFLLNELSVNVYNYNYNIN